MTKAQLHEYRGLIAEIDQLKNRQEDLVSQIFRVTPNITDDVKAPPVMQDKMAEMLAAKLDLQQLIADKMTAALVACRQIEQAIESLPARERCLMRMRYIDGKGWEQICFEMGYSWRQVHRLHGDVLIHLDV